MADGRFRPVEVPADAWRAVGIREALCGRDVTALLRQVQAQTGASQARMAAAAGFGQGRFNEVFNGHREVKTLDALERIAAALAMPDDARVLFGLAPVHAGSLAGHAEISAVYATQAEAARELREHAASASRVDILAVRALGVLGLNDSLLRGPLLDGRDRPADVRVLLLDPESPAVAVRAAETGESAEGFAAGIRLSLARLAELAGHPLVRVQTAVYDSLPVWRLMAFDSVMYLSAFSASAEGHRSAMYRLTAATDGVLHAGMSRQFGEMWRRARHVSGKETE
jgi:transcriptional regulator with XRE-family HTH domain